MKVIKFERPEPPPPEPDHALVAVLEEMLARAKAGESISLHAVEGVNDDYNLWDVGVYDVPLVAGRLLELALMLYLQSFGLLDDEDE